MPADANSPADQDSSAHETRLAHQPPRRTAPAPRLSSCGFFLALLVMSLLPLAGLSLYAIYFGKAADKPLPVRIELDRRPIQAAHSRGAVVTDVVVIENLSDRSIPNLTADLNGQYFLYRSSPLGPGETLVLPQMIFKTKSNQTFNPKTYPVTEVTVTGRLPSGARGVTQVPFD